MKSGAVGRRAAKSKGLGRPRQVCVVFFVRVDEILTTNGKGINEHFNVAAETISVARPAKSLAKLLYLSYRCIHECSVQFDPKLAILLNNSSFKLQDLPRYAEIER